MHTLTRHTVLAAFAVLLCACGGGGGSSGATGGGGTVSVPPPKVDNSWLQFTPASVDLTTTEGRSLEFSVTAKSSKTIAQAINIGIIEPKGIITTEVVLRAISQLEYKVTLHLSDKLSTGAHNGQLEVRLCEDNPVTCAKPIEGSPWFVPLNVTVQAATDLRALTELPQLGIWTTLGGNARHTAYVPITLDPAKFSQRWAYSYLPAGPQIATSVSAHQDGRAFIRLAFGFSNSLRAIDETSGRLLWQTSMPNGTCGASPPALADGKVFVAAHSCASGASGSLMAYDQKTGQLLYQAAQNHNEVVPPFAVGDELYLNGRSDASTNYDVVKVNPKTGATLWKVRLPIFPFLTMSADAQALYVFNDSVMTTLRLSDGVTLAASTALAPCYQPSTPVLGTQGQVYAGCQLRTIGFEQLAFDSVAKKAIWSATAVAARSPALAGTTLYTLNGAALEARNVADGKLLWTTAVDAVQLGSVDYLLVTDNLAFVSGTLGTIAIDLPSRKLVWSFPHGGPMAISSRGVLYLPGYALSNIQTTLPALIAINLK